MFYSVRHVTRFRYSEPVRESVMELRMQPRSGRAADACASLPDRHQIRAPSFMPIHDHLGNAVYLTSTCLREHDELRIEAQATVVEQPPYRACRKTCSTGWNGAATTAST